MEKKETSADIKDIENKIIKAFCDSEKIGIETVLGNEIMQRVLDAIHEVKIKYGIE